MNERSKKQRRRSSSVSLNREIWREDRHKRRSFRQHFLPENTPMAFRSSGFVAPRRSSIITVESNEENVVELEFDDNDASKQSRKRKRREMEETGELEEPKQIKEEIRDDHEIEATGKKLQSDEVNEEEKQEHEDEHNHEGNKQANVGKIVEKKCDGGKDKNEENESDGKEQRENEQESIEEPLTKRRRTNI